MDDLAGLLDFAKTPTGQGLLATVAGGLSGARRGTPWNNVGRAGLAGLAGYSNAVQTEGAQELREIQLQKYKADNLATQQTKDAIGRITAGREKDPKYQPSFGDLVSIDKSSALKSVMPDGAIDFGLEPKVGMNPATGKTAFFVQDKRGGTRWLDAAVPPDYQLIAGSDYKAPSVFDRRAGQFAQQPQSNSSQESSSTPSAPVDHLAPWTKVVSPKEQDQLRARVFETENKRLDDLRAQLTNARSVMSDLDRFGQLNREQGTGSWLDRTPMPSSNSQKREMEAISSRLAPSVRPAGSGTTSDRDLALYLAGLPGVDKPGDVNKNIRTTYQNSLKKAEDRFAFMEKYLTEKGHLNGADTAYQNSLKKQPTTQDSRNPAPANPNGNWADVNKSYASGQESRDNERLAILQQEMQSERDPTNRAALQREIDRAGGKTAAQREQPTKNVFSDLPKANSMRGTTIRDTQTGKFLRSNGMSWVEVK